MELYKRCPDRQNKPEPACSAQQHQWRLHSLGSWSDRGSPPGNMDRSGTARPVSVRPLPSVPHPCLSPCPQRDCRTADGTPYPFYGLLEPYEALRTIGTDAVLYMRVVQEGIVVVIIAWILSFPPMLANMQVIYGQDEEARATELMPFVQQGLLTGVQPQDVWTANATWLSCPLGIDAPRDWGRAGGNAELNRASDVFGFMWYATRCRSACLCSSSCGCSGWRSWRTPW